MGGDDFDLCEYDVYSAGFDLDSRNFSIEKLEELLTVLRAEKAEVDKAILRPVRDEVIYSDE